MKTTVHNDGRARNDARALELSELVSLARAGDVRALRRSNYQTETGRCSECPCVGLVVVAGAFRFCPRCFIVALVGPELGGVA